MVLRSTTVLNGTHRSSKNVSMADIFSTLHTHCIPATCNQFLPNFFRRICCIFARYSSDSVLGPMFSTPSLISSAMFLQIHVQLLQIFASLSLPIVTCLPSLEIKSIMPLRQISMSPMPKTPQNNIFFVPLPGVDKTKLDYSKFCKLI